MATTQEVLRGREAPARGRDAAPGMHAALGTWLAALGWAAMAAMWLTGSAGAFGHDQEGVSGAVGMVLFLVGWLVMVAAMMLPSSLPTLRLVDDRGGGGAGRFLVGHLSVWALFGLAAYMGDGVLHLAADRIGWLADRPELIIAGAALLAGGAEMLGRPAPPVLPSAGPRSSALETGRAHAMDRIRRCWPLMLFAMAVGMTSPTWMVVLTLAMVLELKPAAAIVLRLAGVTLVALGAAVVIEPSWAPLFFGAA